MSETYYKVWTHIEKINEEEDLFEDTEDPISTGFHYATEEEAIEARSQLLDSVHALSKWSVLLQYPEGQLYFDHVFARNPKRAVTAVIDSLVADSNDSVEASDMELLLVMPGHVDPVLWRGDYK